MQFVLGIASGFLMTVFILSNFPKGSVPYIQGMLDCKLQPKECELRYQKYLTEKKVEQLSSQINKIGHFD